jgi:hypothetical protein
VGGAKIASVGFALIAFATGFRSAWLWYRASRVQVAPIWITEGLIEPLDPTMAQAQWIVALLESATKSGDLNRKAAVWTAATVVLATLSTLTASV